MNQEIEPGADGKSTSETTSVILGQPSHPKTTKPPYYHPDTNTYQEEVGRFFRKTFLRPAISVTRFGNRYNGIFTSIGTVVIAVFTGFLYYVSSQQATIISNQLKVMQLDERPWVSVQALPTPAAPLMDIGGVITMTAFNIAIKNVGKSPARQVYVYGRLITENVAAANGLFRSQQQICEPLKHDVPLPEGVEKIEWTMFPGDAYTQNVTLSTENNGAPKNILKDNVFVAVGCIDYKFMGQDEHHQTAFVYDLRRNDSKPIDISKGAQTATSDLRFTFDMGGNGPAD